MSLATDTSATYQLLAAELQARGYSVSFDRENNRTTATYTSPKGGVWRTLASNIQYPFTNDEIKTLSVDKSQAYAFAESRDVPTPFTLRIGANQAIEASALSGIVQQYAPLIVKPNNSSLSKGLTLGIEDVDTLTSAIEFARSIKGSDVLVQEQVYGDEVRFVIIKGKVRAALLRQTPRVVGDGNKTVQELVAAENEARSTLTFTHITYPQLTSAIIDKELLESQYIPAPGEVFEFSKATMIKNGCSVYDIYNQVHPSYIEHIEHFSKDVNAAFFVADFLIKDYKQQLQPNNYWFLEFNVSPVLKLCYGCRDGKMFDVIPLIADLVEESVS